MFKGLFIKKVGKRSTSNYLESPLSKEEFLSIISTLPNINLENISFLESFYKLYCDRLFPKTISKPINSYSKYFWRNECLGIESSSNKDQYWLDRGWSIEETRNIKSLKYGSCSLDYYIAKGYSEEDAKALLKSKTKNITEKANLTKKQKSEEDPTFSKRGGYGIQKWIFLGYSEEEAKQKYEESRSSRFEKIQEFHRENPNFYKGKRIGQIEYWIDKGFSEEEAKEKVRESQRTFTLQKCIEKYGEEEGKIRFQERQKKWTKSLYDNFKIYGDGRSLQSQWAIEIINCICDELKMSRPKKEKWISSGNLRCSYDFTLNDKIIEFNGDIWHANPKIYDENFLIPKCNIKASEKWKIDEEKIKLAESHGYKVLVIWESEFKSNPNHIITKCLNFLNG